MPYINNPVLEKIKKHSSIGIDKTIKIFKKRPSFVKFRKINIEVNSFHKDIINKYKSISDTLYNDDFNYLHFTLPLENATKSEKDMDEKVEEKIKIVLEKIYVEQEQIVKDFRIKELLLQKSKLIEHEKNIVNERFIKEVLYKEINRFKKSDAKELDERIEFYQQVNTYIQDSKINHIHKHYRLDNKKTVEFNTKEIQTFIRLFKEVEVLKAEKNVTSLDKVEKTLFKSLDIQELKKIKKQRKSPISSKQALNVKSLFSSKRRDLDIFNDLSFEKSVKKSSKSLFAAIEKKETKILTKKELKEVSSDVVSSFDVQIQQLFQVKNNNMEIKSSFEEDIRSILNNEAFSKNRINEELMIIKDSYVNTVLINGEKEIDVKDEKNLEQKLYKQTVIQLAKAQIIVKQENKNILNNIIKTVTLNKRNHSNMNEIINEVLIKFDQTTQREIKHNSIYNLTSTITNKYINENVRNVNKLNVNLHEYKINKQIITNFKSETTLQNIINTIMHVDKTPTSKMSHTSLENNITVNKYMNKFENKFENRVESIYKNIIEEIKISRPHNHLSIIDKKVVLERVNKLVQMRSETQIKTEYEKIRNEYITKSVNNTTVQNILNTSLQNSVTVNKYENKFENRVESIYKNIIEEIKVSRPHNHLSIVDKKVVLERVNKLVQMRSETQIKTEYEKIKNEYIKNSLLETTQESYINKTDLVEKFHQDKLVILDNTNNNDFEVLSNERNILLANTTALNNKSETGKMVYIGNPSALLKHEKNNIEACNKSIEDEIKHKKYEIINNVQNVYENLDENLDELALKIFNDIKDEINIEYKRI